VERQELIVDDLFAALFVEVVRVFFARDDVGGLRGCGRSL